MENHNRQRDDNKILGCPFTSLEFISQLAQRRIYLSCERGTLKYRAPEGALDEPLRLTLRQYKDGLLKTLQQFSGYVLLSPLSYNQQSLFFMYMLEPASATYNLALSMSIKSAVDKDKMKNALEKLVQRHEQLRTTYGHIELSDSLIPVQFVQEKLSPSFEVIDVSDWPEEEITKRLQKFYEKPFNLEQGPVVRAGLFIQDQNKAMFVLAFHHIAADAWSIGLIRNDLAAAYNGELGGTGKTRTGMEYTDFVLEQRRELETTDGRKHLDYWITTHRPPAPALDLGKEKSRPAVRRSVGATHYFRLDQALRESVENVARNQGITSFALLLSVFQWLLYERSGKRDIVIGIPVLGHNDRKFENTVGYFVNPVPLRSRRTETLSFHKHAQATAQELRLALEHREAPFADVVEKLGATRDVSRTPVFQVMFNLLSRKMLKDVIDLLFPFENPPTVEFGGLKATSCPLNQQEGQFDLTLELIDYGVDILGLLKYCTDLFTAEEAEDLASAFRAKLEIALANPETTLFSTAESEIAIPQNEAASVVAISASFTAEFLQEFLEFWFQKLGWRSEASFAPFNQVFQELLNPSSLLRSNRRGLNVIMVRIEDLIDKNEALSWNADVTKDKLSRALDELKQAVTAGVKGIAVPLFFVLCPPSPRGQELENLAGDTIEIFLEGLRSIPGVTVLTHEEIHQQYPVADYHEPLGETIGAIPFTRNYLAAVSTALVRTLNTLSLKPIKALAVDCDGTLWQGVVGEDGPTGVIIGPQQRAFQQFLLDQYNAGVILCLCSKNQEADVWSVFDQHLGMVLKREHISFWKINWEAKSGNIRALARDVNIGLDTFAFLDDNPLERAEVGINCPSVLCLEFPEAWQDRTQWLEHCWLLDHPRATAEDKKRQDHYRSEQIRDSIKQSAGSLAEFLEKLELQIDLKPAEPADYDRLAQLSVRTNQFNTTTLRLTTQQVTEYATTPGMSAHIALVRDRFGDYGLVGAMLVRQVEGSHRVDGMFLSCRALGRSVEYRMASYLATKAKQAGCAEIEFPVKTTERNEPARTFLTKLNELCGGTRDAEDGLHLNAQHVAEFRYETMSTPEETAETSTPQETNAQSANTVASQDRDSYSHIASYLCSVDAILNAVEQKVHEKQIKHFVIHDAAGTANPETETEELIAKAWQKVLGLTKVNTQVKFFEIGGTSLLMVRVAIELKRSYGIEVSIIDLFNYSTIAGLAQFLDGKSAGKDTKRKADLQSAAIRQRESLSTKQLSNAFKRLKETHK